MSQNFSRLLRGAFAGLDLLLMNVVFFLLKLAMSSTMDISLIADYNYFIIWCNVSWLAWCWIYSIYQARFTASLETFVRRTLQAYVLFLIGCIAFLYFRRDESIARSFIVIFFTGFAAALFFNRCIYLFVRLYFKNKDYLVKRILIVGHNETSLKLVDYLESQGSNYEIVGFCEDEGNVTSLTHYPILGDPSTAMEKSLAYNVNEIYSTILPEQNKGIYNLMDEADRACIRFKLIPNLTSQVKRQMHVHYIADMPVLSARPEPLDDLANRIKKRVFDIAVSSFVIIFILSWLIPLLALLIKLESRGPVFFVQKRSGVNNQPFNCIKFRSMRENRDADKTQATKNDKRLTRLGKILRKTSLDEFPQFFNVLRGNMSIVGPRPHMLKHTEDYSKLYNHYMIRHFLKPGITGWAQIHGYRGEITSVDDIRNRVEYDIWYLENWNEWLDLRIMFLTVYNMIKGEEKAY